GSATGTLQSLRDHYDAARRARAGTRLEVRRVGIPGFEITEVVDTEPEAPGEFGPRTRGPTRSRSKRDAGKRFREPFRDPTAAHRFFAIGRNMNLMAPAGELRERRFKQTQIGVVPREEQNPHQSLASTVRGRFDRIERSREKRFARFLAFSLVRAL